MKYFMSILGIAILIAIGFGFYFKNTNEIILGDRIIGIAILVSVFILLPCFLYHSWKGKKLEDYTLSERNIKKMKDRGLD